MYTVHKPFFFLLNSIRLGINLLNAHKLSQEKQFTFCLYRRHFFEANGISKLIKCFFPFQKSGQNVQMRQAGALPQVVQFPTMQQTVPVQVPISTGNGQTIYQTVHVPLQAFAGQMPGLVQPQMQIFPQIAQVNLSIRC